MKLGTRDEGKVSGRSHEDAQITDEKRSAATDGRKAGIGLCTEERRRRTLVELTALRPFFPLLFVFFTGHLIFHLYSMIYYVSNLMGMLRSSFWNHYSNTRMEY